MMYVCAADASSCSGIQGSAAARPDARSGSRLGSARAQEKTLVQPVCRLRLAVLAVEVVSSVRACRLTLFAGTLVYGE